MYAELNACMRKIGCTFAEFGCMYAERLGASMRSGWVQSMRLLGASMRLLGAKYADVGCMSMETFGCMYAEFGCMYAERLQRFGCVLTRVG